MTNKTTRRRAVATVLAAVALYFLGCDTADTAALCAAKAAGLCAMCGAFLSLPAGRRARDNDTEG